MLTLSTCRKALWNHGSNVPYSTATPADISSFDFKLNQVMERIFSIGTFKGMWKRPTLRTYGNRLTLPRGFDTARGADPCDGPPFPIYSEFHRFVAGGDRYINNDCICQYALTLISESAQTFIEPSDVTYTIRAVATETATGGLTFTGGFDENDDEILDTVSLDLANGATETTQQYTQLPDIQKIVTTNSVSLYYVDVDTSTATLMAVYAPGETTPSYRQYLISGGLADGSLVRVLCKLGFEPAITNNDLVIPGHMGALKLGLQALQFEDKVDPINAGIYWGPNYPDRNPGKMSGAIDLLDAEIAELGAGEQVAFQVSPDFGAGSIVNVI